MSRTGLALPGDIKNSINFEVIYPAKGQYKIDKNSYDYLDEADTLLFKVTNGSQTISLSQQPTPANFDLGKAVQGASQLLSQGKSYGLISSKLGQVAITNFYNDNDLSKVSQSAILESDGTLVTAQLLNGQSWGQADWEAFFNNLKVSK